MSNDNVIAFPTHRIKSPVVETSKAEPIPDPAKPVTSQRGNDSFDVRTYFPKERVASLVETGKGTTQIPHKILEFALKVTDTKAELIVFTCLIRYTIGFQRSHCSASISYIIEWTGLHKAGVRRGLKGLIEKGLIRQTGWDSEQKVSSVYEIPIVKAYLEFLGSNSVLSGLPVENKEPTPTLEHSPKNPEPCSKRAQGGAQNEHSAVLNTSTKKESINKELKKTTHTHKQIENQFLESYFSNLKPRNKRRRERKDFEDLQEDYSLEDISDSLRILLERGLPGNGAQCHSPMAFLSCSMESVLAHIRTQRQKAQQVQSFVESETERKRAQAELEDREEQEVKEKVRRFEANFPTPESRDAYFAQFAEKYPVYAKSKMMLRNTGISAWCSSQASGV